jgi:hypothetical protein
MVENEKISGLVDGEMDEAQEATIYSGIKVPPMQKRFGEPIT